VKLDNLTCVVKHLTDSERKAILTPALVDRRVIFEADELSERGFAVEALLLAGH